METETTPSSDQLAISFLAHFIDEPCDVLADMYITRCLSDLLASVVNQTVELVTEEKRTIH